MNKCFISTEVALNKVSFYITDSVKSYLVVKSFINEKFIVYDKSREVSDFKEKRMKEILDYGYWKPYILKKSNINKYK